MENEEKVIIMPYETAKDLITTMVDIIQDYVSPDEFKQFDEAGCRAIEALDKMIKVNTFLERNR